MEYKILISDSAVGLTNKVNQQLLNKAWTIKGSHKVVEVLKQTRYSGAQTTELEYSQTLIKE